MRRDDGARGMAAEEQESGGERVGEVLPGGFRLEEVLGRGGMSTVYAAVDRRARRLAVKVLHRERANEPAIVARFLREAKIARVLDHRARVAIEGVGETDDGAPFLVMERIEGESLDRVWRRLGRRLPLRAALHFADQLLDLLSVCHAHGVVHCDIKPANVIVTADGIKVVDFGIAYAPQFDTSIDGDVDDVTVGTPSFMPPEQVTGDRGEVDARVDVFAVGALLFTLLSGKLLHRGRNHDESLLLAATERAPSLAEVSPETPDDVVAVVDRALSFQRDDRFADAAAMRAALAPALTRASRQPAAALHADSTVEPPSVSGSRPPESMRESRRSQPFHRPVARGTLEEAPLPQLLKHVCAHGAGALLVLIEPTRRIAIEVRAGAPRCRPGEEASTLAAFELFGALPPSIRYEIYLPPDDALTPELQGRIDPLAAIMASTRRWRGEALRSTLRKLGDRPLVFHRAAALDRFSLRDEERRAIQFANERRLDYAQLSATKLAPQEVIDAVVYALGLTRHLDLKVPGAWPFGVARPMTR